MSIMLNSLGFVLAAVCIVVFAVHRSADSQMLRWSWWYVLGAMSPVLATVAAQAVLVVLPPLPGRGDRYVALGCLTSAVLLLVPGVPFAQTDTKVLGRRPSSLIADV